MHHHHFVEESHPHSHPHGRDDAPRKKTATSAMIKDPHHSPMFSAYTPSRKEGQGHASNDVIISQTEWETHVVQRNPHSPENENLEKRLKWTLYICTILFFIFGLAVSIVLIVIMELREKRTMPKMENSQRILNDLPRIYNTMPFHTLVLKDTVCDETESIFGWLDVSSLDEKLAKDFVPVFEWQGTNYGCLCDNDAVYFGNTCNNHPECKKVPAKSSNQLIKINTDQFICGARYKRFSRKPENSSKCPQDSPFLVGEKYCADVNRPPVTVFNLNKTKSNDDDDSGLPMIVLGEFSANESPVIGIKGVISEPSPSGFPCVDSEKAPKPKYSKPYPFLKELNEGCGAYGGRNWYTPLGHDENATSFLINNDMMTVLQELHGFLSEKYLNKDENITFFLEKSPLTSAKAVCLSMPDELPQMLNVNVVSVLQKKADDLSIIIGLTLAFSVIGIIIILFTTFVLVLGKYMLLTYIVAILLVLLMLVLGIYLFATRETGVSSDIKEKYKMFYEEGCFPEGFSRVIKDWLTAFGEFSNFIDSMITTSFVIAIIYLIALIGLSIYGEKQKTRPILKRAPYTPARRRTQILQHSNSSLPEIKK